RASLVRTRRAERDHDRTVDVVRADVRRALRRITVQQKLRAIQETQVEENELRLEAARAQFDLGQISNRDVVDAEEALLDARNGLASAISSYRSAILEFRRDTGTLRVTDDGQWLGSPSSAGNPADVPVGP
ncbi:MAG: TolC family protein, partial [Planctomycetes bacterium]|nr:TolC family protein [Planctomycetota bacterium]